MMQYIYARILENNNKVDQIQPQTIVLLSSLFCLHWMWWDEFKISNYGFQKESNLAVIVSR